MMKKPIYVFALIVVLTAASLVSGCSISLLDRDAVRGSGNMASETRSLSEFTSIDLLGSFDVDVTFGDAQKLEIEAEDNLLPLIETKVVAGQLMIGTRPNTSIVTSRPIRVTIVMRSLEGVTLSGSGDITIADLQGGRVDLHLIGSGNIIANGRVERLQAEISGSGNIRCEDLQAEVVVIAISGSGDAQVYASQSLEASVSGSGHIRYAGNPAQVERTITGSGSISER